MEGVNPFIKSNKHRMIMFLDELGVRTLICTTTISFEKICVIISSLRTGKRMFISLVPEMYFKVLIAYSPRHHLCFLKWLFFMWLVFMCVKVISMDFFNIQVILSLYFT